MTTFAQLHLLVVHGGANLNRDEAGRPKTMMFGGAERLRISSQSFKRALRTDPTFVAALKGVLGVRSRRPLAAYIDALASQGLDPADAIARAEAVLEHDRLGRVIRGTGQIEQLVHLGPDELDQLNALAGRTADTGTGTEDPIVLKPHPRAVDIALFGRMLADNPKFEVYAAAQVAHAFTTHRASVEDDFFTAIDDLAGPARPGRRSAYLGQQEFGAGTFYGYICVDCDLLLGNLNGDTALATLGLEALLRGALTVSPSGRQNAFASRARASYALLEIGPETPRSLAGAFQHAVGLRPGEDDLLAASIARVRALKAAFAQSYGERFEMQVEMVVGEAGASDLQRILDASRMIFAGHGLEDRG